MSDLFPGFAPKTNQARINRNTELLLDASIAVLARDGWSRFTLAHVARQSGLSKKAAHDRVRTRSELAAAAWQARIAPMLSTKLNELALALAESRATTNIAPVMLAILAFALPGTAELAAAELLVVAPFESDLNEVVNDNFKQTLLALITPSDQLTAEDATRNAYVISLALGLLMFNRFTNLNLPNMLEICEHRLPVLLADDPAQDLPYVPSAETGTIPVLDESDESLNRVLTATVELIGQRGFENVAVAEIAAHAGFSEGFIFSRYKTKIDLFMDAANRLLAGNLARAAAHRQNLATQYDSDTANYLSFVDFMRPEHALVRSIALQQAQLAWHNKPLRDANTEIIAAHFEKIEGINFEDHPQWPITVLSQSARLGLRLISSFEPAVWQLPHTVVLAPANATRNS